VIYVLSNWAGTWGYGEVAIGFYGARKYARTVDEFLILTLYYRVNDNLMA
jgi:hypothetical protein